MDRKYKKNNHGNETELTSLVDLPGSTAIGDNLCSKASVNVLVLHATRIEHEKDERDVVCTIFNTESADSAESLNVWVGLICLLVGAVVLA